MTGLAPAAPAPRGGAWWLAVLAMVASAACWGSATVMTKDVLTDVPPFTTLALQLTASVAFLWSGVAVARLDVRIDRDAGRAALSGLLEPGLAYGVGVPGLLLTSASSATVISAAEPAVIVVLAWILFRERLDLRVATATCGAMAGVVLIALSGANDGARDLRGDLLVFAGVVLAALYVLSSSRFVASTPPLVLAALQQSAGLVLAVALWAVAWAAGFERGLASASREAIALALASGVVQYALAFWLYLVGLRTLPVGTAGMFLALTPVFGVAGAVVFLAESLSLIQALGSFLVIATLLAILRRGS